MKNVLKKCAAMIVLSMVSVFLLVAEETPVENLYEYTLDNGLSVFVAENHSAPLVYIEIAVRAGAVAQSPENAGLFHLYEHMMFKGNSKYRDAQAMQTALNDMGVSSWNGTTSTDRVNYFITVPTDQFETGLEFWSYAVRDPLMIPKEFEAEKKVVLSEIQGYFGQPGEQAYYYNLNSLFPEAPWTFDPSGSAEVIQNATVEQLRAIQSKYYIPNNAAVFVGGDVNPDEAYELVKKVYGDWKKGDDPWKDAAEAYSLNPLDAPLYCVIPYDELSPQLAEITVSYRGPDADFAVGDAAVGEALTQIMSDPNGLYAQTLVKNKKLQIPDTSYVWGNYSISRRHGAVYFGCDVYNPSDKLTDRAKEFYNTVTQKALPAVEKDKSLASQTKKDKLIQIFKDGLTWETQTANSLLSTLSYYWTYSTRDYYMTREDNYKKIEKNDISEFLNKYVYNSNPIIMVFVNPDVYEQTKAEFDNAGFVQITADNAFWWSK